MSIIQTHPTQSDSSKQRKLYQVAPSITQVADSVEIAKVISVKWWVCLRDIITGQTCSYEVFAVNNPLSGVSYNIANIVGSYLINTTLVTTMGGTHMVISITNNIVNTIEIRISKTTLEL
jgi:hypothetical protein